MAKTIIYNNQAEPIRDCEMEKKILENDVLETSNELVLLIARTLRCQGKIDELIIVIDGVAHEINSKGKFKEYGWDIQRTDDCLDILIGIK